MSQTPSVRTLKIRGVRALLPCPLADQGVCPYFTAYGCTDAIRTASQKTGYCGIEAARREKVVDGFLLKLGYRTIEELPAQIGLTLAALAEAVVYSWRALIHLSQRQLGAVDGPSHEDTLRYFTAGCNAQLVWEQAFFDAVERERSRSDQSDPIIRNRSGSSLDRVRAAGVPVGRSERRWGHCKGWERTFRA